MFELRPITPDAIPRALDKAERYRLLNEPSDAESICLDILRIDPDNQKALVAMLLAVTDQFEGFAVDAGRAQGVLHQLKDFQSMQDALGPAGVDRESLELVGHGQQHRHQGLLVVRVDAEDVEADALGVARLVQQAVALRLVEGPGNGVRSDR